jgi:hypothetical protein
MEYEIINKSRLKSCPECGTNANLVLLSERSSEETVDVWIACKCGYDPTSDNPGNRIETVMGVNEMFAYYAALDWNDNH